MRRSLTTPDRRQTPPPLAVVRQRKTPAAPRYTVSASGSPVRNENLLLQLKFCSLQSPMHYLSCEKSGLVDNAQLLFANEVLFVRKGAGAWSARFPGGAELLGRFPVLVEPLQPGRPAFRAAWPTAPRPP